MKTWFKRVWVVAVSVRVALVFAMLLATLPWVRQLFVANATAGICRLVTTTLPVNGAGTVGTLTGVPVMPV